MRVLYTSVEQKFRAYKVELVIETGTDEIILRTLAKLGEKYATDPLVKELAKDIRGIVG